MTKSNSKFRDGGWIELLKGNARKKTRKLIHSKLPRIEDLEVAHSKRREKEILHKIFSFYRFIDDPVVSTDSWEDSSLDISDISLNTSSETSSNSSFASVDPASQDDLFSIIEIYKRGVMYLKGGNMTRGKDLIYKAACEGFPHAIYAHAILKFKEAKESNTPECLQEMGSDRQEMIKEAVDNMINSGRNFFPLNSFVLGYMELNDVGGCGKIIYSKSGTSWKTKFSDVLLATEGSPLMDKIKISNILSHIKCYPMHFFEPDNFMMIMGNERGMDDLKWMVQCVKYELARNMILNSKNILVAECVLKELSTDRFADAKYLYAFALLKGIVSHFSIRGESEEVYTLLREAVDLQHEEAKLLLGTLPFRRGFEFLRKDRVHAGMYCFHCLKEYVDNSSEESERGFREKASTLVAEEYLSNCSPFVIYDEERARSVLEKAGCSQLWGKVEDKLRKRQDRSENALWDVLKTLRKLCGTLDQAELYAEKISPILRKLSKELRSSGINIPHSKDLSLVLQQLGTVQSFKKYDLLSLQGMSYDLEEQVEKQQHISGEGILLSLEELQKACISLHRQHVRNKAPFEAKCEFSATSSNVLSTA